MAGLSFLLVLATVVQMEKTKQQTEPVSLHDLEIKGKRGSILNVCLLQLLFSEQTTHSVTLCNYITVQIIYSLFLCPSFFLLASTMSLEDEKNILPICAQFVPYRRYVYAY